MPVNHLIYLYTHNINSIISVKCLFSLRGRRLSTPGIFLARARQGIAGRNDWVDGVVLILVHCQLPLLATSFRRHTHTSSSFLKNTRSPRRVRDSANVCPTDPFQQHDRWHTALPLDIGALADSGEQISTPF